MIMPSLALPIPPVCDSEPELPICLLPGGDTTLCDTAETVLIAMGDGDPPAWFSRGGSIVSVSQNEPGELRTREISPAGARVDLERHLAIRKVNGNGDLCPATMPESTAKAILKSGLAEQILPPLRRIQRFPYLRENGGEWHIEAEGYNRDTGIYLIGNCSPQDVTLEEATGALLELLSEFHFATPSDQSRAVASILTPALQGSSAISGSVPVTIIEADQSQAGKGFFIQTTCAIYNEDPHMIVKRCGGAGSTDESLATNFLSGRTFVVFDNVRGSLRSEYLESALTAQSEFPVRVPYKEEVLVDVSQSTIWVTSNGFDSTIDLANRASFVRIRKRANHVYPPLPRIIEERRDFYQGCVLRVVRSFLEAGCPQTEESRHSFHQWSGSLDWIVQHLFHLPPLLDGHEDAQNTIASPNRSFLRAVAHAARQAGRLGESLKATDLADLCIDHDVQIFAGRDNASLEDNVAARTIGKRLQPLFKDGTTYRVDEFEVERQTAQVVSSAGNSHFPKTYVFSETGAENSAPAPAVQS